MHFLGEHVPRPPGLEIVYMENGLTLLISYLHARCAPPPSPLGNCKACKCPMVAYLKMIIKTQAMQSYQRFIATPGPSI